MNNSESTLINLKSSISKIQTTIPIIHSTINNISNINTLNTFLSTINSINSTTIKEKEIISSNIKSNISLLDTSSLKLNINNTLIGKSNILIDTTIIKGNQSIISTELKTNVIIPEIKTIISNNNTTVIKSQLIVPNTNSKSSLSSNIVEENDVTSSEINSTYPQKIISINTYLPIDSSVVSKDSSQNETESENINENYLTIYSIFYLQIHLRANKLFIYIIVDFKVPNDFIININVVFYIRKRLRGLDEYDKIEKEIPFFQTHKSNNNIIEFSNDLDNIIDISKIVDVEMKNIAIDSQGKNDTYYIINIADDAVKNTEKVDEVIRNGGINFTKIVNYEQNYLISQYKVESASKGCNFDLKTNKIIDSNHNITLKFEQYNKSNTINAKCQLLKNKKIIPCSIDRKASDIYILEDFMYFDESEIFTITSNNKNNYTYSIECIKSKYNYENKSKSLSTSSLIIIIIGCTIALVLIVIAFVYYIKNRNKLNQQNGETNFDFNSKIINSSLELNKN